MSEQNNPQIEPQLDENQIIALRREKLHNIRKERNAYPNDFKRDSFAADLHTQYGEISKEELDPQGIPVKVAGRMMLKRQMGKASFATIQDVTGQIQLYLKQQRREPRSFGATSTTGTWATSSARKVLCSKPTTAN